jgi:hypothetical protein
VDSTAGVHQETKSLKSVGKDWTPLSDSQHVQSGSGDLPSACSLRMLLTYECTDEVQIARGCLTVLPHAVRHCMEKSDDQPA